MADVIKCTRNVHEYYRVGDSILPCVHDPFHQYHHCLLSSSPGSPSIVLEWDQLIFLYHIAEQFHDDAFDKFSKGVFQCDGTVSIGFRVVWFSRFSKDNSCGRLEGGWEMRCVDRCLNERMEVLGGDLERFL